MEKLNISFNGSDHELDPQLLAPTKDALKEHLTDMAPEGNDGLETITWDGVVGDRAIIDYSFINQLFVKVSDRVLTEDELIGATVLMSDGQSISVIPEDLFVTDMTISAGLFVISCIKVGEMDGIVVSETGTYVLCNDKRYVTSLTFPSTAGGDAPVFEVGKTVTFKEALTIDDIPEEYHNLPNGQMFFVETSDTLCNFVIAQGGVALQCMMGTKGSTYDSYLYMDEVVAPSMGVNFGHTEAGWYFISGTSGEVTVLDKPLSVTITDEAIATGFASVPFLFATSGGDAQAEILFAGSGQYVTLEAALTEAEEYPSIVTVHVVEVLPDNLEPSSADDDYIYYHAYVLESTGEMYMNVRGNTVSLVDAMRVPGLTCGGWINSVDEIVYPEDNSPILYALRVASPSINSPIIHFDGTDYPVDAETLQAATDDLVAHMGTLSGESAPVVEPGATLTLQNQILAEDIPEDLMSQQGMIDLFGSPDVTLWFRKIYAGDDTPGFTIVLEDMATGGTKQYFDARLVSYHAGSDSTPANPGWYDIDDYITMIDAPVIHVPEDGSYGFNAGSYPTLTKTLFVGIPGGDTKIVVGGVEHRVDSGKLQDTIAKIHTALLFADGTLVNTNGVLSVGQPLVKNEYGFCYEKMYACLDYGCGFMFHDDLSISYYGIVDYDGVKATYEEFERTPADSFVLVEEYPDDGVYRFSLDAIGWGSALFFAEYGYFQIQGAPFEIDSTFGGTTLSALGDLWLPNDGSITAIADGTFKNNTTLTSIKIPNGVTSIGPRTFMGCERLKSITIPDSVTEIGNNAFENCLELKEVNIPSGVTSIGAYAFSYCYSLTTANIPEGVTAINESVFYGCSNLKDVVIPAAVTDIGAYAFYNCSRFTEINIPDGVTNIGSSAFNGCSNVATVCIPASVTNIDGYAFSGSRSIQNVYYDGTLEQWCNITFCGTDANPLSSGGIGSLYVSGELLGDISIPNSITEIGNYTFSGCANITSVAIPNGVTSIGEAAFSSCSNMTNIVIPDSVTSIGKNAFSGCSSMTDIVIPDGVTSIEWYAFNGCTSLSNITIPNSVTTIDMYAFQNCSSLTNIAIPDGVTSIGHRAFAGSGLTEIVIPDSVTTLNTYMFANCASLKSITLGNGVTSIPKFWLSGCSYLENLTIPFVGSSATATSASNSTLFGYIFGDSSYTGATKVTQYYVSNKYYYSYIPTSLKSVTVTGGNILYGAFYNCDKLTNVTIGDGVTSIGERAFYQCYKLTSVTIPSSMTSIGNSAFYCTGFHSNNENHTYIFDIVNWWNISFGNSDSYPNRHGVLHILDADGSEITEFVIPNDVTSIPSKAFSSCSSLTSIKIHDGVTSIGNYAFSGCTGLTNITIPDNLTSIGSYAFSACTGLTSVTIPDGLTSIGAAMFQNCTGLTSVVLPDTLTKISSSAFYGCTSLTGIEIPNSVEVIDISAFRDCSSLTSIVVPNSVWGIGNYAFSGCTGLTSITIPEGVTMIGQYAFYDCRSLTSITIPDSVQGLDKYTFQNCTSLTRMTIPFVGTGRTNTTTYFGYIFGASSYSNNNSYVPESLKSVVITDAVQLGSYAFYGCSNLTSITLCDSITSISSSAFTGCTGLTDLYYTGTESQWNAISGASGNSGLANVTIHYNYAGE